MKNTYNIPSMLEEMVREEVKSNGEYPSVLYLRQDEYDLFQEWAKSYHFSSTHYYHYSFPHPVRILWDEKLLH